MKRLMLMFFAALLAVSSFANDYNIISEQPEGELRLYRRSGGCYDLDYGTGEYSLGTQNGILYVVFADNNVVYFKNPISYVWMDTWVKGTLSLDHRTITIPLNQVLDYDEEYDATLHLVLISHADEGDELIYDGSVTYTIDDQGVISQQGTNETLTFGFVWSDDASLYQYCDFASVYTPFTDDRTLVTLPAGLQLTEMDYSCYPWSYDFSEKHEYSGKVKLGFQGKDVYLQGLLETLPEAWIKGSLEGDTITFLPQYLGVNKSGEPIYIGEYEDGLLVPFHLYRDPSDGTYFSLYYLNLSTNSVQRDGRFPITSGIFFGQRPAPLEAPEGIEWVRYPMSGTADFGYQVTTFNDALYIGIVGNDVYLKNFLIDDYIIKGTFNADKTIVTFPSAQFCGMSDNFDVCYALGADEDNRITDIIFTYDAASNVFRMKDFVVCSYFKDQLDMIDFYCYDVILGEVYDAQWVAANQGYENKQKIEEFSIDEYTTVTTDRGRNIHNSPYYLAANAALQLSKDNFITITSTKTIKTITLCGATSDNVSCKNLTTDEESFNANDDVASLQGEFSEVVLTATGLVQIQKINIIYTDGATVSIKAPQTSSPEGEVLRTFDLTGRKAPSSAKGLLIKQVRQADGSVKVVKVLC